MDKHSPYREVALEKIILNYSDNRDITLSLSDKEIHTITLLEKIDRVRVNYTNNMVNIYNLNKPQFYRFKELINHR